LTQSVSSGSGESVELRHPDQDLNDPKENIELKKSPRREEKLEKRDIVVIAENMEQTENTLKDIETVSEEFTESTLKLRNKEVREIGGYSKTDFPKITKHRELVSGQYDEAEKSTGLLEKTRRGWCSTYASESDALQNVTWRYTRTLFLVRVQYWEMLLLRLSAVLIWRNLGLSTS
jgi:hypothetical protein